MKVLVFTSLFPNNMEPNKGVFIKERMRNVAKYCEIEVVAPVPYFPPIGIFKKWYKFSQIKNRENIEGLKTCHPRFFVTPKVGMLFYGFFMFLSVFTTVKQIKKGFNFDLIDAHYIYPDGFAAVLLGKVFKKPVVVSARGTDINLYPFFPFIRKQIIYTMKNAKKIISVCEALKDKMISLGVQKDKIEVIPNGVDTKKFKVISQLKSRTNLELPIDRKILLSVGCLVKHKGFQRLIGALDIIKKGWDKHKPPFLVIVGDGPYRTKLELKIKQLRLENDTALVGVKPHADLYKWFNAADLFCLASSREGWPNVLLEALACGVPVVATRVDGIPEIIYSEEYGFLVDNQDKKQLAKAISDGLSRK